MKSSGPCRLAGFQTVLVKIRKARGGYVGLLEIDLCFLEKLILFLGEGEFASSHLFVSLI